MQQAIKDAEGLTLEISNTKQNLENFLKRVAQNIQTLDRSIAALQANDMKTAANNLSYQLQNEFAALEQQLNNTDLGFEDLSDDLVPFGREMPTRFTAVMEIGGVIDLLAGHDVRQRFGEIDERNLQPFGCATEEFQLTVFARPYHRGVTGKHMSVGEKQQNDCCTNMSSSTTRAEDKFLGDRFPCAVEGAVVGALIVPLGIEKLLTQKTVQKRGGS